MFKRIPKIVLFSKWKTTASPKRLSVSAPLNLRRMKFKNPMIRQLCLGWTSLVLSMENVDLESFIPRFLEGIFDPGILKKVEKNMGFF